MPSEAATIINKKKINTNISQKSAPDYIFLFSVFLLLIIGFIMILSSSQAVGLDFFNDSYYFIKRHAIYLFLGMGAFSLGVFIDYKNYRKWAAGGLILTVFLLFLTYVPGIGRNELGATRWVNLGIFSFQPSELAKLAIIIFVATYLENKKIVIRSFLQGVMPVLMVVGFIGAIVLIQPDLGTTIVILSISFIMIYASGAKTWHMFILALIGARTALWVIWRSPYQKERILAFLDPWKDSLGIGFHIIQSWLAIGSGGFFGLGLGNSRQKFYYLPQQFTDFIFAILCEEGGFIFATFVVVLFGIFLWKGLLISVKAPDYFSRYLVLGLVCWIFLQAFINISVVLGLLPTTGIPLTFLSFGGTALVVNLYSVGIITQISTLKKPDKDNK
ncbi:MAG: putative lipid II flippase FtsW [Candidatus Margulisiibacteriota bacterium]|nr:MAG: cell division protein FtsW [Candidatus Margulisbacteria bacterium GWD2_39_127]OGI02960.1 MAG: cell division protein FtsW [Candidatus Margulisbacteria bacterium GWF2_38_17]OGI09447.1 MAG: cell division protein FtsW [Candidatus Margulisbacteria bacterium GWE2_39_32]PZM78753.1 MAG: putative lipid II flippase FtsW [Candidatus Margulisiibacteriota bacterium]HAR63345.1 putative lipid II flippase FtsW [Candidatus Margulisiibacteriota bacterium]